MSVCLWYFHTNLTHLLFNAKRLLTTSTCSKNNLSILCYFSLSFLHGIMCAWPLVKWLLNNATVLREYSQSSGQKSSSILFPESQKPTLTWTAADHLSLRKLLPTPWALQPCSVEMHVQLVKNVRRMVYRTSEILIRLLSNILNKGISLWWRVFWQRQQHSDVLQVIEVGHVENHDMGVATSHESKLGVASGR